MRFNLINLLRCPICNQSKLSHKAFNGNEDEIINGVLWCTSCSTWYPIEDRLLEFLVGDLAYPDDRNKFWIKYSEQLTVLGLTSDNNCLPTVTNTELQAKQQTHFDWYAENSKQTYLEYERKPFWLSADRIAFEPWREEIQPGRWLLDVGCAEGRSTLKVMDLDINVVGFDISKRLIRQAIDRYQQCRSVAKASFFTADATSFPVRGEAFDYVLVYGVLHHLPDPEQTCHEVSRVLKHGGSYFGSENNVSLFRGIFDLLQKLNPIWHEEAGPEAIISKKRIEQFFQDTDVQVSTKSYVFLPPHLLNLMSERVAYQLLRISDRFGQSIPFLRDNGGLIIIRGDKT
jgi:ubiquinone/menaquinone biosynthesis C-methylase UbiE/uncharacterized protein YbaR (Trm112 family)